MNSTKIENMEASLKASLLLVATAFALCLVQASETPALPTGAAQTVFDYYFKIQNALAQDSTEIVAINAGAVAEIVRKDTNSGFPPALAGQADALARGKNIAAARHAFKAVSGYLIQYVKARKVPVGLFHEVHCAMVNLNWLQNHTTVRNPYLGKSRLNCGTLRS